MPKQYMISFSVTEEQLPNWFAKLADVNNVKIEQIADAIGDGGTVLKPKRGKYVRTGGKLACETEAGKILLSVFTNQQPVAGGADFAAALRRAEYAWGGWPALAAKLVEEGVLIRRNRFTYRLPTDVELSLDRGLRGRRASSAG